MMDGEQCRCIVRLKPITISGSTSYETRDTDPSTTSTTSDWSFGGFLPNRLLTDHAQTSISQTGMDEFDKYSNKIFWVSEILK